MTTGFQVTQMCSSSAPTTVWKGSPPLRYSILSCHLTSTLQQVGHTLLGVLAKHRVSSLMFQCRSVDTDTTWPSAGQEGKQSLVFRLEYEFALFCYVGNKISPC